MIHLVIRYTFFTVAYLCKRYGVKNTFIAIVLAIGAYATIGNILYALGYIN